MRILVTGAGGFVGQKLIRHLLDNPDVNDLSLMDIVEFAVPDRAKVTMHIGDIGDADFRKKAIDGADAVIHLASILGGAAETNYAWARRVNVDATQSLFEDIRDQNPKTRVVAASTIGVFSTPMPPIVTDNTPTDPVMVYAAHKLMMEIALTNFTRRGWLDGLSLRPSGVTARDGADMRLRSAFLSHVFYAVKRGEDIVLPVKPESRVWMASADSVAWNFMHGALVSGLRHNRAFTLPAQSIYYEDLVEALYRRFPGTGSKVTYAPDEELIALFGCYPELETAEADRLGFNRDESPDDLVARSMG